MGRAGTIFREEAEFAALRKLAAWAEETTDGSLACIDASETAVKHAPLADYRIVYFATHGLVAGDIKGVAEPSLALSLPRQPTALDDGLLTASEVAVSGDSFRKFVAI